LRRSFAYFDPVAHFLETRIESFDLLLLFQKGSPLPATTPAARIVAFFALSVSTSETWSANLLAKLLQMNQDPGEERVVTFYGGREQILRGEHSWALRS
jgi:hypothetical protein